MIVKYTFCQQQQHQEIWVCCACFYQFLFVLVCNWIPFLLKIENVQYILFNSFNFHVNTSNVFQVSFSRVFCFDYFFFFSFFPWHFFAYSKTSSSKFNVKREILPFFQTLKMPNTSASIHLLFGRKVFWKCLISFTL